MASTYLERTLSGTSTNRKLCTFSYWVKRSDISDTRQGCIGGFLTNSSGQNLQIGFYDNGFYAVYYDGAIVRLNLVSSALARDVSAWYHVVVAIDTTQTTTSNRAKMYVNGVQVTSFTTSDYPVQNVDFPMTNGFTTHIGKMTFIGSTTEYFDGLMASVYFIDGQALTPSSFGQTDATTGIWKPKAYSGSYGTNGFFLKFENSGSLGTDSSGNGNNFTVNGTPTQTVDTPSNVFATLNPLSRNAGTFENGNTSQTSGNDIASTIGVTTGKWYWEVKRANSTPTFHAGICSTNKGMNGTSEQFLYGEPNSIGGAIYVTQQSTGTTNYSNGAGFSSVSYNSFSTPSINSGDILGFALDLNSATKRLDVYQNGSSIGNITFSYDGENPIFVYSRMNTGVTANFNFGNGYFATTAISSPYADGAGLGKFQYQPPTGYYALCTKNINVYG